MGQLLLDIDSEEGPRQRLVILAPRFGEWDERLRGPGSIRQESAGR